MHCYENPFTCQCERERERGLRVEVMVNVLRCQLTYQGQAVTNAEAWFNNSLRPRKPEGSLGRPAQNVATSTLTQLLSYGLGFQILHFYWWFSSDIGAVKGLMHFYWWFSSDIGAVKGLMHFYWWFSSDIRAGKGLMSSDAKEHNY